MPTVAANLYGKAGYSVARKNVETRSKYVMVALFSALVVAFESVSIEGALNIADIDLFLVSSVPSVIGGLILMGIYPKRTVAFTRNLGRRGWLTMLALCVFAAVGVILWFDAVSRIGASKEALLGGGSSEVLFVVILSAAFLSERLTRLEGIGSVLVVVGVFVVLVNIESVGLTIGVGEVEAIVSSLMLGCSVVMATSLLKTHDLTPLSGVELLLSGVLVIVIGAAAGMIVLPEPAAWMILIPLGLFPAVGLLTYNAPLPKIGASLTSVLFALNGIMTVGVQLLVLSVVPDADIMLPQNVVLAVLGGAIAFAGVYLLNKRGERQKAKLGPRLT
jgi:drug/metabolite transporter (DMT)-like permease